jgi:phasin family protein
MADKAEPTAENAEPAPAAGAAPASKAVETKAATPPAKARKPKSAKPATAKKTAAKPKPAPARKAGAAKRVSSKAAPAQPKAKPAKPKAKPAKPAARAGTAAPEPTITELKEIIMATAKTQDFIAPFQEAAEKAQEQFKTAYEKGNKLASELAEFSKGNVEAVVESTKLLAGGMQEIGKETVEETKSAYETASADLKSMAAVKSPTELFQIQSELARRNFDAMVGLGSKNSEKLLKLANDAFAPISSRMSLAAEKLTKAA